MELFLLRHGLAVERGTSGFADDNARPLTPKGRRQLIKIVQAMKKMELSFDRIFTSPLPRAEQTAEIVAGKLKMKKRLLIAAELRPGGDAKRLIRQIAAAKRMPKSILLVGHEPDLSELISLLVTGTIEAGFALKKCGLAKLEVEQLRPEKCAVLTWLLLPDQLKLMC